MGKYKLRYLIAVGVLLTLPAFTCGVAPVLRDLIQRVEVLETESELLTGQVDALEGRSDALEAQVGVLAGESAVLQAENDAQQQQIDALAGAGAEVLHVFDNNGVDVGIYAGADTAFTVDGTPWLYRVYLPDSEIMLNVRAIDGVQEPEAVWFYFESTDCTGAIYARQAGRLIRGDLYIATGTEPVVIPFHSKSWLTPFPVPSACSETSGYPIDVFPATVIDPAADLGLSFPLPAPLVVAPAP